MKIAWTLPRIIVVLVLACGAVWSCTSVTTTPPRTNIRIGVSGSYASWIDKLVAIYRSRLHNTLFSTKEIAGSVLSIDMLERKEVDVTITGAHLAFSAFNEPGVRTPIANGCP